MCIKKTVKVFILFCFMISIIAYSKLYAEEKDSIESVNDSTVVLGDMGVLSNDLMEAEEISLPPIEKMPELIKFVNADYPEHIYKQGIEGSVLLNLIVSDSGTVDSVAVEKGVHPYLDSSALKAAAKFRFTPAIAGGEPVSVFLQYEYQFSLKEIVNKLKEYVNLTGRLLEKGTRRPIRDALVVITFIDTLYDTTLAVPFSVYREYLGTIQGQYIEEDRLVTMTDSMGHFAFYSLPAGPVHISSPLSGYEELLESEEIRRNEKLSIVYYVRRLSYSDYEIVVFGKAEEKEVSRHQLTLNEIKRIPGLGGDAVKVVQALPGVARPIMGSGAIIIRGSYGYDSEYFIDGVDLPILYHFGGLKSTYNSDALESVDFYPGGFSTRYGNSIGGVVELKGRSAKTDRWHGSVDLSSIDGSLLFEGPVGDKVSFIGSIRRSFAGDLLNWFMENSDREFPFSLSPFYWDYLARTDIAVHKNHTIFFTAFGSRDTMNMHIPSATFGSDEIDEARDQLRGSSTFHMGLLGWDWDISEKLRNSLRYKMMHYEGNASIFGFVKWNEDYDELYIRDELTCEFSKRVKLRSGLDFRYSRDDFNISVPAGSRKIVRDTLTWNFGDVAAYVNLEWKPAKNLLLIPGLRYDYYPQLHHDGTIVPEFWNYDEFDNERGISGDPSLRFIGRYGFLKNHTAKCAIGTYNQAPGPSGQVIMESWGDPKMPTTKASHYVLGYEWQITDLIHIDIQGYINRQWDIPRQADRKDFNPQAGKKKLWLDDGRGKMRGIEIMLRHNQGERFFGWLAYSLSRSERYNPTTGKYEIFKHDQTHNLQLLGSWRFRRDWDFGFRFRYVSGNPFTPVIGTDEIEAFNYIRPVEGERNSERLDPFVQLDLRVDKKFVYQNWMYSMYLDLQNLSYFLYKSPEFEIYNDFYTDKTTVSMIFMPAIGFTAEF